MPTADAHRRSLAAFLAERDAPCPGCTYNLRGLTSDRCPECGAPLTLELVRRAVHNDDDAPLAMAWAGVLILTMFSLPVAVMLLLMPLGMAFAAFLSDRSTSFAAAPGLSAAGLVLLIPYCIARRWTRWEARLAPLPVAARWAVAALAWSWLGVVLLVIFAPARAG